MAAATAAPEKPRHGLRLGAIAGPVCLAVVLAIALGTVKRSPWPPALVDKACPVDEADQSGPVNTTPYGPELHEALLQTLPGGLVPSTGLDASQPGVAVTSCRLQGSLDGCCNCTYQEVDEVNDRIVYPTLKQLVATPFFRYFKVNLWCDCPLWPDDSMCMLRACSVCPCENDELPQTWLRDEARNPSCSKSAGDPGSGHPGSGSPSGGCNTAQCTAEADGVVDRELEPVVLAKLQHLHGWRGLNNPWMAEGEEDEEFLYINLLANPERYTGYKGEHAHRIWSAIYNQSCFTQLQDCHEKRLFYRLISGMHASISAHIAANYLLDEEQGVWGPSVKEFKERLGTPAVRQRVKNLYFAYLFVLRAVSKAGPLLRQYTYDTGMAGEDARTAQLIKDLLSSAELPAACFMPFEPGRLWQGEMGEQLMETMQAAFRNITRVMDCVGCEKCKLWGKLQTLGVATALKILFSSPDCASAVPTLSGLPTPFRLPLSLERNEVIALLNLLERFAASLHHIHQLSELLALSEPADIIQRAADTIQ